MNEYAYWRGALEGKDGPAAVVDDPQPGFYRMKRKGVWVPVAVWPKGNGLDGAARFGYKVGADIVGHNMGSELWPSYCANPVLESVYRSVAESGKDWPDADPTVAAIIAQGKPIKVESKPAETVPAEEPADPTAEFEEQIGAALGGVATYSKIESDEADVRALSLRNLLNELGAATEKAGKAEYEPMFREYKRIYDRWISLAKRARGGAAEIKVARDAWADAKFEADKRAKQRAADAANEAMVAGKPPEPTPPSNLPPPTPQVRPAYGRASPTGTKMVVTAVDYDKFFAALKLRPEWPVVQAQFDEWAQKLANKGIIPDGVTAEERANTR